MTPPTTTCEELARILRDYDGVSADDFADKILAAGYAKPDSRLRAVVEAAQPALRYLLAHSTYSNSAAEAHDGLRAALAALDTPALAQPDADAVEIANNIAQSWWLKSEAALSDEEIEDLKTSIASAITADRATYKAMLAQRTPPASAMSPREAEAEARRILAPHFPNGHEHDFALAVGAVAAALQSRAASDVPCLSDSHP